MNAAMIARHAEKTMTSREIANLTNKEHRHVRRDIEVMFVQLEKDASIFGRIYLDSMNREQQEYLLPYDETVCLLTGYDARARMAVIKRWQELEAAPVVAMFNIPTTLSGALRLAAEQAETIEVQARQLEEARPHLAFVEKYVDTTGLKSFRQVCKLLKVKENDFRTFLMARNIMYRLGGEWVPYACHIDAGRFEIKTGTADSGHAFNSAKFTSKGVEWVAGELAKFNLYETAAA